MARVYVRKGPDAKSAKVTVPMTEAAVEKLREFANAIGKTPTVVARELIENGVAKRGEVK
jgi:hypothetical protein